MPAAPLPPFKGNMASRGAPFETEAGSAPPAKATGEKKTQAIQGTIVLRIEFNLLMSREPLMRRCRKTSTRKGDKKPKEKEYETEREGKEHQNVLMNNVARRLGVFGERWCNRFAEVALVIWHTP